METRVSVTVDTGVVVVGSGVSVVVGVKVVVIVGVEVVLYVKVVVGVVVAVAATFRVSVEVVVVVTDVVVETVLVLRGRLRQLHPEEMIDDLKAFSTDGIVGAARLALPQTSVVDVVVTVVNETCFHAVRIHDDLAMRGKKDLQQSRLG